MQGTRHISSISHQSSVAHPVGSREWFVAASAGLTLAFSTWGLGGIPTWSLHVLLAGGVTTFALALLPFPKDYRSSLFILHFPLKSYKQLALWLPFYFSLAFLIYILVGALNSGITVVKGESSWWVEAISVRFFTWLPTSVQSPYEPMNAWRVLVGFTGAFTLMWGIWAGITHRKPTLFVLWMLLLSGASMGFVGIIQHLTEANAVLWTFPSSNENFWGTFFYRNQGAAYLNLILIVAGVLYFYHAQKTRQRGRSGGPHFLCIVLFATVAASVGLALSRGGILFAGVICLSFLTLVMIYGLMGLTQISSIWAALIPLLLLVAGLIMLISYIDLGAIEKRFGNVEDSLGTADQDARYFSSKATLDMAQDRLLVGWGAGSFRYVFPMYQRDYPEIYYSHYLKYRKKWMGRRMYRYAHNDILQFVAEYGLIGSSLVFGSLAILLIQGLYHFRTNCFAATMLLVGVLQSFGHAFLDFIFNSPSYWITLVGLLCASVKLLSLESGANRLRYLA